MGGNGYREYKVVTSRYQRVWNHIWHDEAFKTISEDAERVFVVGSVR